MTHAVYPSLAGKTVVITGGGSGIGEVIVEGFVRQKSKVFFLDVAETESKALVARLGDGVQFIKCDVTDTRGAARRARRRRSARPGPVAVLVNNAANDDRHKIEDVTPEYWEKRIAVNLRHLFFASQAVSRRHEEGWRRLDHQSRLGVLALGHRGPVALRDRQGRHRRHDARAGARSRRSRTSASTAWFPARSARRAR